MIVVGVAKDIKCVQCERAATAYVYIPYTQAFRVDYGRARPQRGGARALLARVADALFTRVDPNVRSEWKRRAAGGGLQTGLSIYDAAARV